MESFIIYLLKCSAYSIAVYIPFILVLRKTTFFSLNRFYLLIGLFLSFALPASNGIATEATYSPVIELHDFFEPFANEPESLVIYSGENSNTLSLFAIVSAIYLLIVVIRLTRLAISIQTFLNLRRKGVVSFHEQVRVIETDAVVPFSFFNSVFVPKGFADAGILAHEVAHVRQRHWFDLCVMELASIILWFNPLMIAYKRSLKQQHEYLADRSSIQSGLAIQSYLLSMKRQITLSIPADIISGFQFQSIKNRINMLTKNRTSMLWIPAYSAGVPMIILLLMAFSSSTLQTSPSRQETFSLGLPIAAKDNFVFESGYGERLHPVYKKMRMHTGIDLVAAEGVQVLSSEDGIVVKAELADLWGNIIMIQHGNSYSTSYSHLQSMNVKKGDKVRKGDVIGRVGHTGLSTKDHLHFEVHKEGKPVDPTGYFSEKLLEQ